MALEFSYTYGVVYTRKHTVYSRLMMTT